MAEKTPHQAAGEARLKAWAVNPAEGGKILRLQESGAWDRCHAFYRGKVPEHMIDGWCARLIHLATGQWPGHQHGGEH